jgi:hypothetical protein
LVTERQGTVLTVVSDASHEQVMAVASALQVA